MKLLSDLTNHIEQPEYKFGRPTLSIPEMVFGIYPEVKLIMEKLQFLNE